jgi:RNA polymerase sporulation-specific sigma factor
VTESQLLEEYAGLALGLAHQLGWFLPGSDIEDLEQEALIGLLSAARSYREGAGGSFPAFAAFCVRRRLSSALKAANREKHGPLNGAERRIRNSEGEEEDVCGFLADPASLELQVEAREQLRAVLARVHYLTPLERRAIFGAVAGYRGRELGGLKQVDNARQRGRVKLRAA